MAWSEGKSSLSSQVIDVVLIKHVKVEVCICLQPNSSIISLEPVLANATSEFESRHEVISSTDNGNGYSQLDETKTRHIN